MEKSVEENSKNTEGCFYECETFDEFKERVQVIENEYKKEL